ncbi:MAG: TonB-dependent receptor [Hyphomonadaceae bacterium]|nr:TonB-dependent receptor [Hyphomonadaceae bacterium]
MTKSNFRRHLVRTSIIAGIALPLLSQTGLAQDDETQTTGDPTVEDTESVQEVITVTGSRIINANISSSSPVTSIGADQFDLRGTVDTIDLVNSLPQVSVGANSQNSSFANGANGTSTLDLRGIGSVRTLALANGKRLPPGSPLSGGYASDVNLIPAPLVERVEIVTGGASAVYGSDAVAGVANFILRSDFEGIEADFQYGFNQFSNDNSALQQALANIGEDTVSGASTANDTYDFSIVMGSNMDDGRGNATVYFRYFENEGIDQGARDFARCALGEFGGDPFCLGSNQGPFPTSFVLSPAIPTGGTLADAVPLYNADGSVRTDDEGNPITGGGFSLNGDNTLSSGLNNAFNFNPQNPIRRATERFNAGFLGHYEISPNIEAYSEFGFSKSKSPQVIAPSAAFGSAINQVNCDNPLFTAEQLAALCGVIDPATGFYTRDIATTTGGVAGDGYVQAEVRRRFVEGGGRTDTRTLTNFRFVGGLRGTVFDHIEWDAFGQVAQTELDRLQTNQVTLVNLTRALDIVDDGNGNFVCRSFLNGTDPNCIPFLSAYQVGAETDPGLAAYVDTPTLTTGSIEQFVYGATAQTDLTNYGVSSPWATEGPNVLIGVEYRRDGITAQADGTNQSGGLVGSGGAVLPTNGETDLFEVFGEIQLPVIQDMPYIKELGLSAAIRNSTYESIDILNSVEGGDFSVNTYSVGATWSPNDELRLRAQYQRAARAPNVFELFNPTNTNLSSLSDPCSGFAGTDDAPTATFEQCARTGVTEAQYGAIPPDSGQLNVITSGNPTLNPEEADTITLGFVYESRLVPDLLVSLDYYQIEVNDLIAATPASFTLTNCLETGAEEYCSLINRGTDGSLTQVPRNQAAIDASTINTGFLNVAGFDLAVSYGYDLDEWGQIALRYNGNYQLESEFSVGDGIEPFDCVGLYDDSCANPTFEYSHNVTAVYDSPWNVRGSILWRYLSEVERISSIDAVTGETTTFAQAGTNTVSSVLDGKHYFDVAAFWDVNDFVELRAGVNNVFDEDPPVVPTFGPSPTANIEANTIAGVYEAAGRFVFVGAKLSF